jgi:hypothetical protein
MCDCVAARPAVVPVNSFVRVARDADVVSCGIRIASQDVDESLLCSAHAVGMKARFAPTREFREFSRVN